MKNYFRLNPYCHLIEGNDGVSIYNLITGDMVKLDKKNSEWLKKMELNVPICDIPEYDSNVIEQIIKMGLGMYYDKVTYIEKLYKGIAKSLDVLVSGYYTINNFYIELDNTCNFKCIFCKNNDNTLYRKTGCKRWDIKNKITDIIKWKDIILQVSKLSCTRLVFIGGEPLLKFDLLKELILYAKTLGITNFLIFTNGSLINEYMVKFFEEHKIVLNIQVLAYNNSTYKEITQMTNIVNLTKIIYNTLSLLNKKNIKCYPTILINRYNDNEIKEIVEEIRKYTPLNQIKFDYIYPFPMNEHFSEKYIPTMYNKKKSLGKVFLNNFCSSQIGHNCYNNQLAITAEGDILPCIMSRQLVLGNVKKNSIFDILKNSKYETYKSITKDSIEKCKDCSFRYGCFDCRAIEMSATKNILGMKYCNIDVQGV